MSVQGIACSLLLLLLSGPATAAIYYVNSPKDVAGSASLCTLRAAFTNINYSNNSGLMPSGTTNPKCPPGGKTNIIYFDFPAGPSGRPEVKLDDQINLIANEATIIGGLISGQLKTRIFSLNGTGSLILENVYLVFGRPNPGQGGGGGAVLAQGNASLSAHNGTRILRNYSASDGGAIYIAAFGRFRFSRTNISYNETSGGHGGAIRVGSTTTPVEIVDSVLRANRASGGGGALYCTSDSTPINITKTAIENNEATLAASATGGAILNNCRLQLSVVKLAGNHVQHGYGGAIYNMSSGRLTIADSHVSGNVAGAPGQGVGEGGAMSSDGELFVIRTSFEDNHSTGPGGAIKVNPAATGNPIVIVNSTFYDNSAVDETFFNLAQPGGALWIPDVAFESPAKEPIVFVLNNTFLDNYAEGQVFFENDNGTDQHKLVFANNLWQNAFASVPNCAGRVQRMTLRYKNGYPYGTQYPGSTCDNGFDTLPTLDLDLQVRHAGYFDQAYALPASLPLPNGDFAVCGAKPVFRVDQLRNPRGCQQGAAERPPTFVWDSSYLPY